MMQKSNMIDTFSETFFNIDKRKCLQPLSQNVHLHDMLLGQRVLNQGDFDRFHRVKGKYHVRIFLYDMSSPLTVQKPYKCLLL